MSEEREFQREEDYQRGLACLKAYKVVHGDCGVPQSFETADGFRLGGWCASRRNEYAKNRLSQGRIDALQELGFMWDPIAARSSNALRICARIREAHSRSIFPKSFDRLRQMGWS